MAAEYAGASKFVDRTVRDYYAPDAKIIGVVTDKLMGRAPSGPRWTVRSLTTAVSGLVATSLTLIVGGVVGGGGRPSRVLDPVLRGWARAWLLPAGARLEIDGRHHVGPGQPYVIVSNHQSNLDPMAHLAALRLPIRFLAMRALFDIPVLGFVLRRIGMIDVNRADPDLTTIAESVSRVLAAGASVLVYPEGATSGEGTIDRFRTGAFAFAIANHVPILPITTSGTRAVWRPGSNAIHSATVRIIIGAPIPTERLTARDAVALRDDVRAWVVENYRDASGSS